MKHALKLFAIIVLVFLIGFFLEETIDSSESDNIKSLEEPLEIISELFSVFVAISVFGITWYAYNKSQDNHSLLLGATFLITGILILFHLLSYPFMPDFINPNSSHKAGIFFIESRLILAILLLFSAYIYDHSLPGLINKNIMILFIIAILSILAAPVFFHEDLILAAPVFFHEDLIFAAYKLDSYSTITILLSVITIITLVTCYLYIKRARETNQKNFLNLTNGSIIILFSNLVYFDYEFSGHFLIITGFFYFYLDLYKSSVELPYEKLAMAEEKAKTESIIAALGDAISIQDTDFKVLYQNKIHQDVTGDQKGKYCYREYEHKGHICEGCPVNMTFMDGKIHIEERSVIKDGQKLFYEITSSPLKDSTDNIIAGIEIARDITKRKQTEEALNKSRNLLDTIKNVQDNFIVDSDIKITLNDILSNVLSLTQSEYGFIGEILYTAKDDPFLKIHAFTNIAWNKENQDFYEKNAPQGIEFYDLKTLFGSVITDGKPVIANDLSTDSRRGGLPEGHPQIYKFLGIPFYHGGKLNGMIGVANCPEDYNEDIIEYLKPFLTTCANIIEAYRIDQRRKLAEKQIEVSLKEKETLLKEIHHRVKNNMQIVSSLLEHQTHYIKDKNVIDIFTESQNRIASMSLVHEKLYQSRDLAKIDFKDYINDLTANLFQSYNSNSGKITLDMNIENIQMDIDFAIPCGLIINELVTNSLKYAFPEDIKGEIGIVLHKTDKEMFELVIGDNGIGLPKDLDFRKTESLGLHLVTILTENQLHGEINLIRNHGTEFQIKFRGTS
ncbi:MAG: PAS domain S-box protein [Candidatus Methanoperedens sp.]|nr:PAS domain S-box protein [Candidatus Methanoperedens sp.]